MIGVMVNELSGIVDAVSGLLGCEVTLVQPLLGGQHALTFLMTDSKNEYVVRVFPPLDEAVVHEPHILGRAAALGALAPRFIATGNYQDYPLIITSKVAGSSPAPELPLRKIASSMAATLAEIHALESDGLRAAVWQVPHDDRPIVERARRAWQLLEQGGGVFTHYDFWCGNALWDGDALTGVVDWSGARRAPPDLDASWCRLDLVLLGSHEAADQFLEEYQHHSGHTLRDIHTWDLMAAARSTDVVESWSENYIGIGRTDLTKETLRARMDQWISLLCAM